MPSQQEADDNETGIVYDPVLKDIWLSRCSGHAHHPLQLAMLAKAHGEGLVHNIWSAIDTPARVRQFLGKRAVEFPWGHLS